MKAIARQDLYLNTLEPNNVYIHAGDEVEFVYDSERPTDLVIEHGMFLRVVPAHAFEDFDDVPTWNNVVKLLHDNGLEFSAEFDVYGGGGEDHDPVVALRFKDDDYAVGEAPPSYRAVDLMNRRWSGLTPVRAFDDWYVHVTTLPTVYSTDMDALLGDLKAFFQTNVGLFGFLKINSEGMAGLYDHATALLRRLQEVV